MSLFPAYSEIIPDKSQKIHENSDWLQNQSFKEQEIEILQQNEIKIITEESEIPEKRSKKDKKSKKSRKSKFERNKSSSPVTSATKSEFTGKEDYYVDKKQSKNYRTIETLYRPARPKFNHKNVRILGGNLLYSKSLSNSKSFKRYFDGKIKDDSKRYPLVDESDRIDNETAFALKTKEINEYLYDEPYDVDKWLELIEHQETCQLFMKLSKTQLADKKCEIIERALKDNAQNEKLLQKYIDIVTKAFPADDVSVMIEKLLTKESTSFLLWESLIHATQGSMARCNVPDVLKLYEKCMQTFYNKLGDDTAMMKLFYNFAIFLRQCGLYEQFFALIKFSLELNISTNKFKKIIPKESDQQILIEYEEVILKSGLPMNEIWLRIEKLRQNFNFLPCPENYSSPDPQRIIYNEDVCNYVYPISKSENNFSLIIKILKLLKLPFLENCHNENLYDNEAEFDDIEKLLSLFLTNSFGNIKKLTNFNQLLWNLIKDLNYGPNFIPNQIGYEIYLNNLKEILLILSELNFFYLNENLNKTFIILWLKLERLILKLNFMENSKQHLENLKNVKSKVKTFLKNNETYQSYIKFYIEYSNLIYENEGLVSYEKIISKILINMNNDYDNNDLIELYLNWIETLFLENNLKKSLKLLIIITLEIKFKSNEELENIQITETQKLLALKRIDDKLGEGNYIKLNPLKIKIYLNLLILNKLNIKQYNNYKDNETFYEIVFNSIELIQNYNSNDYIALLEEGITRYPKNLIILRYASLLDNVIWIKLKKIFFNNNSDNLNSIKLIFLIISLKYRYNFENDECIIRNRIKSLIRFSLKQNNNIKKNAIIWRIYLRVLFNSKENLDKIKNILFEGLDECPWNKSLYMDGCVYVPQELSQMQDLIIEKQLRIYALPEELEILRNENVL